MFRDAFPSVLFQLVLDYCWYQGPHPCHDAMALVPPQIWRIVRYPAPSEHIVRHGEQTYEILRSAHDSCIEECFDTSIDPEDGWDGPRLEWRWYRKVARHNRHVPVRIRKCLVHVAVDADITSSLAAWANEDAALFEEDVGAEASGPN